LHPQEKNFTIQDGDLSHCPPKHLERLMKFQNRFSTSKLDLEITDIYESSQPTLPRKSFNQGCCRLPHNKYQFALKSINQLETAGVVQTSDSPLRSNVVLAPKSAYEKMNVK
jgi:hypothetical protein